MREPQGLCCFQPGHFGFEIKAQLRALIFRQTPRHLREDSAIEPRAVRVPRDRLGRARLAENPVQFLALPCLGSDSRPASRKHRRRGPALRFRIDRLGDDASWGNPIPTCHSEVGRIRPREEMAMRDPSLVASKADIRQQAIKGGEGPIAD